MKAKLLVEIDTARSPHFLDFDNYILMYFIPRILLKPGIALSTEEHYNALLVRAANLTSETPTINLTIQEKKKKSNKENAPATQAIVETKGKKVNMQSQVIAHISDQYSRRKIPPSSQEISSERKTSRSFRIVGSVFFGSLDVSVHIATFSLTRAFTIRSTMKGWSAGHLRWYFLFVPPHLSCSLTILCSSKPTCCQISKSHPSITFLTQRSLYVLQFSNVALTHRMRKDQLVLLLLLRHLFSISLLVMALLTFFVLLVLLLILPLQCLPFPLLRTTCS